MAVDYATAVKTDRMNATRSRFANGTLEILTAANALLATFALSATAGSVTGAVWTLAYVNGTVTAGAAGTAAKAQIKTSSGVAEITGLTVGTSGADINLNNTNIANGQSVTLTSSAITHAA
jgi:hypothetical protein